MIALFVKLEFYSAFLVVRSTDNYDGYTVPPTCHMSGKSSTFRIHHFLAHLAFRPCEL